MKEKSSLNTLLTCFVGEVSDTKSLQPTHSFRLVAIGALLGHITRVGSGSRTGELRHVWYHDHATSEVASVSGLETLNYLPSQHYFQAATRIKAILLYCDCHDYYYLMN